MINTMQSLLFKILFIIVLAMLAWQSTLHFYSFDVTKGKRNSLTEDSVRLIKTFENPVNFKLFSSPSNEETAILNNLLKRYQYHQPHVKIDIINPDLAPELLRQYDIRQEGVVIIEYQKKIETINAISERNISNALQRLLRQNERWIVFLEGHGERHPYGDANHDISTFSAQLASKGFIIESVNLSKTPTLPDNTSVLVLASAQIDYLPGEIDIIRQYVARGGNLLWLIEPNEDQSLSALAEQLNIEFLPGVIVDPNAQLLGLNRVDYALINEYPLHPITEYTSSVSIFPQAMALLFMNDEESANTSEWQTTAILETQDQAWNEVGPMQGSIIMGDQSDESAGPLTLGIAMQKDMSDDANDVNVAQRIVVIGDGDFLANQFIGNGANAELGYNILNWLSHDDSLVSVSAKPAPDTTLELNDTEKLLLAIGFLIALPALLLIIGLRIWVQRKNR